LHVIGIDFSIQFPSACISRDFKSFRWVSCVNSNLTKAHSKLLDDVQIEFPELEFLTLPPKQLKQSTYSGTERAKLLNYSLLVDTLVDRINEIISLDKNPDHIIVSIEGVAYGAQGNALIDICQATGMLRKSMLDSTLTGQGQSLFVFSPGELKNAIGAKGNAGKFDIFNQFKNSPQLAEDSALHRAVVNYEDLIVKGETVKSPFTDMIDAYLAVLKIHNSLKDQN